MALSPVVHTDPASLGPLLPAWRALADAAGQPYSTPEWMLAFWEHRHAAHAELRVVEVREGDEVVGIAPCYLERRGPRALGATCLWPLASGIGQRTGPLARAGREAEVAEVVLRALGTPGPATIELPAVAGTSPWPTALARAYEGAGARLRTAQTEPGLCVRLAADHDAWLAGQSKNFRKKDAKRRRALDAAGVVLRTSDAATLPDDLAATFRLHHARFAAEDRASSITPDVEAAVTAAAVALQARDRCVHLVLERDGEVLAGDLYLVAGDRMCGWNGGFSPDAEALSPGIALLVEALREAHARGLAVLDLGAGDQEFKHRFADEDQPLRWARVADPGPRAAAVVALVEGRRLHDRVVARLARYAPSVAPVLAQAAAL